MTEQVRVLVPVDGSKVAEHALAYVPVLMPLGISQVELVSVVGQDVQRGARGNEAEGLRQQTGLEVVTRVLTGVPAVVIVEEAEASRPDILLLSTHGASGVSRWRVGSVADKVVRGASCPTLIVGPGAAEREDWLDARIMPGFNSILVPLDGSALAEQALPFAARFADAFGSEVHLVSVVSIGDMSTHAAWAGVSPKLDEDLAREAGDYLEQINVSMPWRGRVRTAVRFGPAADALDEYIRANAIDLAIMTTHGRGGLLRTALGSTTDRLLGSAPSPLLVIRDRE